jgi:hypothetical protein
MTETILHTEKIGWFRLFFIFGGWDILLKILG